jgi:hypothetical protein
MWAVFRDGCYVTTTKTWDEALADEFLNLYLPQEEAKKKRIIDARFTLATIVVTTTSARIGGRLGSSKRTSPLRRKGRGNAFTKSSPHFQIGLPGMMVNFSPVAIEQSPILTQ